jgi:hypothetical protein
MKRKLAGVIGAACADILYGRIAGELAQRKQLARMCCSVDGCE